MNIIFNFNIAIMVSFTRYTDDPIEYAPWGDARPYDGGFRYNCMMIELTLEDPGNHSRAIATGRTINDEECGVGFCTLCEVQASVRQVTVRGLCELSMFDRVYNYVINEDGQPMYLGSRTSVIFYNKTIPSWVW